jgi:S1-C subfamily serine protease
MRLGDIEAVLSMDPERAIHLIGSFQRRYASELSSDQEGRTRILYDDAVRELEQAYGKAVSESRWTDAASLSRSLSAVGSPIERLGEAEFLLREARDLLRKGEDVPAFLTAALSHSRVPLGAEDAAAFLQKAVESRQRRTTAFFLKIAEQAGAPIPDSARTFAAGRDSPADMIKGVATVWVDRGIKIDRGMGVPDRIIGSAFFIDSKGYLITNYHVVASEVDPKYEGYSRLYIRLGDASKPRIPAKVIGWDPLLDLALLKAEIVPEFVFGVPDEADLEPGERILVIGSPAGLENTVTAGIVSAMGRRFLQVGTVVQIDAAVNHGNSGGPVVDMDGRLAGVVFAGIEQFEGLNFAVPVSRLAAALPALYKGGRVDRAWVGCSLYEGKEGIEVIYVAPGTPAADQAVPEGALLTFPGTVDSASIGSFQDELFRRRSGELVAVGVNGEIRVLKIASRPQSPLADAAKRDTRERLAAPLFGLLLSPSGAGPFSPEFTVKRVLRGSVADEAGLSENDPVSVKGFELDADSGVAVLDLFVKKRRMGYLESTIRLPALVDNPDTL